MGNQQSKPPRRSSTQHEKEKERDKERELEREKEKKMMGRRISFQALSHGKSTAADPSATTESAVAQPILRPLMHKPSLQQHLQPAQSQNPEFSDKSPLSPTRWLPPTRTVEETNEMAFRPKADIAPAMNTAEPSVPVDVPGSSAGRPQRSSVIESTSSKSTPQASTPHYTPVSGLQRPPRLPLAIADEVRTPESPGLGPSTAQSEEIHIFDDDEVAADMPRKGSMVSSMAAEEEDESSELQPYAVESENANIIPTRIDWKGQGDKVYVTGTFAHWDKKFRLHRRYVLHKVQHIAAPHFESRSYLTKSLDFISRENEEVMTATIGFPPGTHHLKFIVDGVMLPSPDLPTTVDIHNVLVNYIEVVKEEPQKGRQESAQRMKPLPPHIFPPIALPPEDELASGEVTPEPSEDPLEPPEEEIPVGDFRQIMPRALIDMELPEADTRFRQAYTVINDTPGPPSLPLFLGRSILNGNLPHKDDNSVLTLPNHTVLNHLATSSIKNGVLATSVTTRYKKKYVTTIMYKPTFDLSDAS